MQVALGEMIAVIGLLVTITLSLIGTGIKAESRMVKFDHRLQGLEAKLAEACKQLTNNHATNLRDDVDDMRRDLTELKESSITTHIDMQQAIRHLFKALERLEK